MLENNKLCIMFKHVDFTLDSMATKSLEMQIMSVVKVITHFFN